MTKQILVMTAALLVATATTRAEDVNNPVTVFVAAAPRQALDSRTPEQRKAALSEAQATLKTLERSLKQQFGKKRDSWPAEAQERMLKADEAVGLARVDLYYGVASDSVGDSVGDVQRALDGVGIAVQQKHVRQVASADEAQLVIAMRARRSVDGTGLLLAKRLSTAYFVLFSIKAGPKVTPEQFASLSRNFEGPWVARPRTDAQEWLFEAQATGSWKSAAAVVSSAIDAFAKATRTALAGATGAQ